MLEGGCSVPVGVQFAFIEARAEDASGLKGKLRIVGAVTAPGGERHVKLHIIGHDVHKVEEVQGARRRSSKQGHGGSEVLEAGRGT